MEQLPETTWYVICLPSKLFRCSSFFRDFELMNQLAFGKESYETRENCEKGILLLSRMLIALAWFGKHKGLPYL